MKKIIDYILNLKNRGLYVDLDPNDTSITLSKKLFQKMGVMEQKEAKVMVFIIAQACEQPIYGFELNPPLPNDSEAPVAEVQFNTKHHCVGFETLVPTVAKILYDYMLPNQPVRLQVRPIQMHERTIWLMMPKKK